VRASEAAARRWEREEEEERPVEALINLRDPGAWEDQRKAGSREQEATQGKVVLIKASRIPWENKLRWQDEGHAVIPLKTHERIAAGSKGTTESFPDQGLIWVAGTAQNTHSLKGLSAW